MLQRACEYKGLHTQTTHGEQLLGRFYERQCLSIGGLIIISTHISKRNTNEIAEGHGIAQAGSF